MFQLNVIINLMEEIEFKSKVELRQISLRV